MQAFPRIALATLAIAGAGALGHGHHISLASRAQSGAAPSDLVGVLANGDPQALTQIGATWYLTANTNGGVVDGMNRASIIRLTPPPDQAAVLADVAARPGSAWVVGNEPNVPTLGTSDNLAPDQYATILHDWEAAIHGVDPSAIIVGPNVLNWSDTCVGCGGYTKGSDWTQQFYAAYENAYGTRPPIDRWGLHSYELNWQDTPTLHTDHPKRQITNFRAWLDSMPDEAGRPIWVTELGFHWAYAGWVAAPDGGVLPTSAYDQVGVQAWLADMLNWLSTSGVEMNVEHTFLYAQTGAAEGFAATYGGLSFFDGPQASATPSASGRQLGAFFSGSAGIDASASVDDPGSPASAAFTAH